MLAQQGAAGGRQRHAPDSHEKAFGHGAHALNCRLARSPLQRYHLVAQPVGEGRLQANGGVGHELGDTVALLHPAGGRAVIDDSAEGGSQGEGVGIVVTLLHQLEKVAHMLMLQRQRIVFFTDFQPLALTDSLALIQALVGLVAALCAGQQRATAVVGHFKVVHFRPPQHGERLALPHRCPRLYQVGDLLHAPGAGYDEGLSLAISHRGRHLLTRVVLHRPGRLEDQFESAEGIQLQLLGAQAVGKEQRQQQRRQ